jgi:hypothetical protein
MGFGDVTRNTSSAGGFGSVKKSADLTSVQGLFDVAQMTGGPVAKRASEIVGDKPGFFARAKSKLGRGLMKTFDVAQRFNYAGASAFKNVLDDDPTTTFGQGLKSGITGKTKHTYSDVFTEVGWTPTTKTGKTFKGMTSFALDVLLDPTTYVTFGVGFGAKAIVKGGSKVMVTRAGMKFAKQSAEASGEKFSKQFLENTLTNMAEKSPALYAKFIDQGGIKFFGKQIVSGGRIAGVVKAIPGMTKLDQATLPIRNSVYSLFNRDASAKYGKLSKLGQVSDTGTGEEFVQLMQRMRDIGKVRSDDALNEVVDIARANKLTARETEIITDAIEAKLPIADFRLENARKLIEQSLGTSLAAEQKAGILINELPNYVPHILVDSDAINIPFKPQGVRATLGAQKGRKLEGTIAEINEAFGKDFFDKNIINTAAIRNVASAKAVTSKEFLTEVAQKFGTEASRAPTGYIEAGAKELKGLKFHPAIAEQIDKFGVALINDEATNSLLRAFDKIQGLWKASVTTIFPAFHGRNGISNVFLSYLDIGKAALAPARHIMSGQLLKYNADVVKLEKAIKAGGKEGASAKAVMDGILNKEILTDTFGKKWTFGELRTEIKNRRVAFGDEFTGFLDIREGIADKIGTAVKSKGKRAVEAVNPFSQQNVAFKTGRKVGNAIEQQARVLNFLTNLEKTGDVTRSAERTKMFLFDYTNLSEFEKTFMRRLIPFYTFTRKNIELQVTQSLKQPGKLATQAKLFNNVSKTMSGSSLTEEETEKLPEFLQEGLGIVYKRDGNKITLINTLGTPIEALFGSLQPNALLGSMSPIIAVPLQVQIGKHFFFDRDLKDVNDATAYQDFPEAIKEYIGYTTRENRDGSIRHIALNPTRMFILNNIPPSSRVVSTIGQLKAENVSGKLKILRQLTGIKPYGEDLDLEERNKERAKIKELQELLEDSGVAPIFRRSFIPND